MLATRKKNTTNSKYLSGYKIPHRIRIVITMIHRYFRYFIFTYLTIILIITINIRLNK